MGILVYKAPTFLESLKNWKINHLKLIQFILCSE
uniref:Uncharacterized protein n=1 Tax=Rhizophora mucronata TaxID=61149 RepID=A0A2P2P8C0_RHIMU